MLRQQIEAFCNDLGLDTLGFIPCRPFQELAPLYAYRQAHGLQNEFEEEDLEKRINPSWYMEGAKTILSIAFPYCDLDNPTHTTNGFSIYTQRLDYHRVVKSYLDKICAYIQSLGGQAIGMVDSNTLPERYIAYLAGVGFIGKNNMIITEKYGSYVFLGEIIMDLEVECMDQRSFDAIQNYNECDGCSKCIEKCPTKSINKSKINPNICLSYITQKKEITDQEMKLLKGNVFGCDFCQHPCPYNDKVHRTPLVEFTTLEYMQDDVAVYAGMENKYFKERISQTSCGWRGKNVIKRNAIIGMNHQGQPITQFKGDSPYINGYIERLSKM